MNELDDAFVNFAKRMGKQDSQEMRIYFMAGVAHADDVIAKLMLEINRLNDELKRSQACTETKNS